MNDDNLISQVYKKIEREKTLINGASALRQQTDNPTVQQRADSPDPRRAEEYQIFGGSNEGVADA
jgi:hypothetical protein